MTKESERSSTETDTIPLTPESAHGRKRRGHLTRYVSLVPVMVMRNVGWALAVLNSGNTLRRDVLGFEMVLKSSGIGLDPLESSIHKQLYLDGIRERESTRILQDFIEPDDNVLDIGANIGYYVLITASVTSGTIYAVEPAPDNVSLLERNIDLNGRANVEIEQVALSDEVGTSKLYTGSASNLYSLHKKDDRATTDFIEVETTTVDRFLAGKEPIHLVRMDIEGHEVRVVDGMKGLLSSGELRKMFVEIHPHNVPYEPMRRFLRICRDHGFQVVAAVSWDSFTRQFLGETIVEEITLEELEHDPRVKGGENAFQLFLRR